MGKRLFWSVVILALCFAFPLVIHARDGQQKGVCSNSPIDPKNPQARVTKIKAGDRIYCLFLPGKTWKELLDNHGKDLNMNSAVNVEMYIDEEKKVEGVMYFKRKDIFDMNYLVLDIAPDPKQMTAYRDSSGIEVTWDRDKEGRRFAGLEYKKAGMRFGPEAFTKILSELAPGRHVVRMEAKVENWGMLFDKIEFEIEGNNFKQYADLNQSTMTADAKGICSAVPIDPKNPPAHTSKFKAGDKIYCLFQPGMTLKQAMGGSDGLVAELSIDGQKKTAGSYYIKDSGLMDMNYLPVEIAPDPANMVSYKESSGVEYQRKGDLRFGPEIFTKILGELGPGRHLLKIESTMWGKILAKIELEIEGNNYKTYADLHQKIRDIAVKSQRLPEQGMKDAAIEKQMKQLITNRGWKNIAKLAIKDKDWWMDRASGGNSAIVSRHMAAAIAVRDGDKCYFSIVTYNQPRLITGGWGALEIQNIGDKVTILCENVKK